MVIERAVVSFLSNSGTGTQDITHSGSWQPKVAIFQWSRVNTSANAFAEGVCRGYGITDGTNQRCISWVSEDNVTNSDTGSTRRNNALICTLNPTGTITTVDSVATFSSWLSNGIQINWTDAPAAQFYLQVLLLGGSEITNTAVGTLSTTTGASCSITGLSFQPDFAMLLHTGVISTGENTGSSHYSHTIGFIDTSGNQWSQYTGHTDSSASDAAKSAYSHSRCIFSSDGSTVTGYSTFSSWNSDGLTLSNGDTYPSNYIVYYLVIKGGQYAVGNNTEPDGTGDQTTTTSKDCKALMIFGLDVGSADTITNGSTWTSGMSDDTNQVCETSDELYASDPMAVASRHDTDQIYLNITANATAASSTLDDEAAENGMSATGFTLNWTNIGQARPFRYVAIGSSGLTSIEKALILRYNIEQQITKQLITRYDILSEVAAKSLTLRYDVTALVEKTLTLIHNISQEITKQLTTRYDISQEITKQLTVLYNIEQEVTKSLTLPYNIEQEITKSLTILYNLEAAIEKSLIIRYDIEEQGLGEVEKSLTVRYDIRQAIEKALTLLYDITVKVDTVPVTIRYDIAQEVTKQLTARYDIRALIEKSLITRYDITSDVTKTLTLLYDIEQTITKVNTLRYNITALIEKPLTTRFDIAEAITKALILRYDITQKVDTVPITLRYDISKEILKSLILRFDIRQEILKELITRYDIEGALEQVIKSLTLRYDIIAEVIKSLTTRYNIEQTLLKALTLRYNITTLVPEKSLTLRYDILQQIVKTLTTIFQIEASIARYITDKGYNEPLKCRIQFIARGTPATVYYDYNSFDTANRPFNLLNLDIRLAQGEIGTFSLSVEDSAGLVDKTKIGLGIKVVIDVKKEATASWQRIMTGFVRRIRPERPATGALIYEITGYGSQIIFNERIVNFKRAAKRTAIDSSIALSTDTRMEAHNLFRDLLTASDILPIRKPTLSDTGGFTDLSGVSSDVIDFISQIAPGLTDAASVANAISEITGCIWGTDENGQPFLRYPTQKHSGIIIKDVPENTDSALDTSINLAPFDFDDSIDTTEGFANRLYVLNAVSTKSTASSSGALGSMTLTTRGIAQQFTATDNNITGAAFILSKVGTPVTKDNCVFGYLRADNNGYPTGPTLASFQITFDQIETAKSTIFVNDIKPKEGTIIPGNKYWWFLFSALTDDSNTIRWHHDNDLITGNRISARLPLIDQDPTKPGNQLFWTRSVFGPVYSFSTFSSVRHILEQSDPESIKEYGLIEQIVDLPAFEDDATFQKALSKIIAYSAKPKRIYAYNLVTIPTGHLFFPGELVTVIDSKASLTSEKNVVAEIAEVTYNWDSSSSALGCRYCDVHLIGFLDRTLDKYLDSKEC